MVAIDFSAKRQVYDKDCLLESQLSDIDAPYTLLERWMQEALSGQVGEPYAFSLATCGKDGRPAVRTLLMREISEQDGELALIFYSNYNSHKGQQLAQNPQAQALFFWADLQRQVRLSGQANRLDREQSARYFASRPKESQLAAWVSTPQSGVVASRAAIEDSFAQICARFTDDVPLPDFWGGYRLVVDAVEFWQGRANRLHDRINYRKLGAIWQRERLLP